MNGGIQKLITFFPDPAAISPPGTTGTRTVEFFMVGTDQSTEQLLLGR